ncbi:MAG: hypothetical protein Q4C13_00925, partial [Clostridia bacterium]|nr:hypothetical protein [Clostridia bacterium]
MIDATLEKAVGLPFVMERLQPRTPWGRDLKARLRPFSPADADKLEDAFDALAAAAGLEGWRLHDTLSRFREIRGTLSELRRGRLSETELFELKRFVLNAEALRALLIEQRAPARFALPPLDAALAVLDPGGARDPAFSAAQSDEALRALLRKKAAAQPGSAEFLRLKDEEQRALESALLRLSGALRPEADTLERAALAVGSLDFALARAELSARYGGVRPRVGAGALVLEDAVNPSVPDFQPLSFVFRRGCTVLTGANMGGKSTALCAVALNVLLALMGLHPFAAGLETPHFTCLRLIAGDHSRSGLSEFGAQAALLADALSQADGDALILIDELARGTNPEEGAAIAAATAEYLNARRAVGV